MNEEKIFNKVKDLTRKGFLVSFYGEGPDRDRFMMRLRKNDFQTDVAISAYDVRGLTPDQVVLVIIGVLENMEERFDGR